MPWRTRREEQIDWAEQVQRVEVEVLEIGDKEWGPRRWEKAIKYTGMECIYTDGSKSEEGFVCAVARNEKSGEVWEMYSGRTATVWDGEVEGLRLAVEKAGDRNVLCSWIPRQQFKR